MAPWPVVRLRRSHPHLVHERAGVARGLDDRLEFGNRAGQRPVLVDSAAAATASRVGAASNSVLHRSWRRAPAHLRPSGATRDQYSFLSTKKEPRMVPASLDFCLANLNRVSNSAGTSIPSESLKPTARFLGSSTVYMTLIDRPLS